MSAILAGLKRLVVWMFVVGLIGVTAGLLADRHARRWYLTGEADKLVVTRGTLFPPWGRVAVPSSDPFATAYEPVPMPTGQAPLAEEAFEDRADLDHRLFDLLSGWAATRAGSGDRAALDQARVWVDRAARLPGISAEQADRLSDLRSDVAYGTARDRYDRARELLTEARDQLRLTAAAHGAEAKEMEAAVERALAELPDVRQPTPAP